VCGMLIVSPLHFCFCIRELLSSSRHPAVLCWNVCTAYRLLHIDR
jgi:hypothetical protein